MRKRRRVKTENVQVPRFRHGNRVWHILAAERESVLGQTVKGAASGRQTEPGHAGKCRPG